MPRPCSVCSHGARDAIDLELVGGDTFAAIAGRHGLHPDALKRHKANHITPAVIRLARRRAADASAVSIMDRLEEVIDRANRLLDRAERKGSLVAGAQLLGQLRMTLETIAKITGELNERPVVNVLNVAASPEWIELRGRILAALEPHPDARLAVAAALTGRQGDLAELTTGSFAVPTERG
jgi:hypothetical protein